MSDVRCTFCDEINPPGQRNCRSCGAELPGAQSLAAADAAEPDALTREVVAIANDAGKMAAVAHYRDATGAEQAEADEAVEAMLAGAAAATSPSPIGTDSSEQEVLSIVRERGKIAGIKRYREITGSGLKEAKDAVEGMMARTATVPNRSSAGCGSYVLALVLAGIGLTLVIAGRF